MRELRIQVPDECQHKASNDGLKQEVLIEEQGPDEAEHERDRYEN